MIDIPARSFRCALALSLIVGGMLVPAPAVHGQPYGDRVVNSPGDYMFYDYLERAAVQFDEQFHGDTETLEKWQSRRAQYRDEYLYMLGLSPLPERTPLQATVTRTLERDAYVVEMVHYQSRPGLYVTGNLYRPKNVPAGERLPAVFYVCGHAGRERNGNKVAYQSHGIWFAQHGYICLVVDSLQLGEIAAYHHGTYRLERWWWHSRGYTPAGVEAWNGTRGIDYLLSRPDVDSQRIAVTGISGGGAATFWIAAADERVTVAMPVSGMADLESYLGNRVINGHCDCMFLYNTFRWPWTRIAGLIAPRPLLFVNSDNDAIFPMDANDRISNRLERLYSLYGASDQIDAVVSVGGHAYRRDIRQATFRFANAHLKNDARVVNDSELGVPPDESKREGSEIPEESLRVFPTDADLPQDQLNTTIDERFVPLATLPLPTADQYATWRKQLVDELRRVVFNYFPATIPAAQPIAMVDETTQRLQSEAPIEFRLRYEPRNPDSIARRVLLVVLGPRDSLTRPAWISDQLRAEFQIVYCEPRGTGLSRTTRQSPPNYMERSHALLGRTIDTGRVWDVIAAANYLSHSGPKQDRSIIAAGAPVSVWVGGQGYGAVLAAYAALLDERIAGAHLVAPMSTHMQNDAPQFLNVLRVCDIPDAIGAITPRPVKLIDAKTDTFERTQRLRSLGK